jgi:esterase/lipase
MIEKLYYNTDQFLAYIRVVVDDSKLPTILFCSGFRSDMSGSKATALGELAKQHNFNYICFDYLGHGQSSGNFIDGRIGLWKENALLIIDQLIQGEVVIVGSSMGGWIGLLSALARPEKVKGFVGVAPAPDFTEDILWDSLSTEQKQELDSKGEIMLSTNYCNDPFPIKKDFVVEAKQHLLLTKNIQLNIPIHIVHGMADIDVNWRRSVKISELLSSENVNIYYSKIGDHRMSRAQDIKLLEQALRNCIADVIGERVK